MQDQNIILYLLLSGLLIISADVITLIKDRNITCVLTGESVYSALYLSPQFNSDSPLINLKLEKRPLELLNSWEEEESAWVVSKSTEIFEPVIDIRWEGFKSVRDQNTFGNKPVSVFFCTTLFIYDGDQIRFVRYKDLGVENSCEWSHVVMNRDYMDHLSPDLSRNKIYHISSENSKIMKEPTVSVKPHEYDFRYSVLVLSFLSVNISYSKCISYFVSVDQNCYLDVIFEGKNTINQTIVGFNKGGLKQWRRFELKMDYYGSGQLSFISKRLDGYRHGFWAITDVHICKPNIDIYRAQLPRELPNDFLCRTLTTSGIGRFREEPGHLGTNVTCTDATGNPYCEDYKICYDKQNCHCSWGFHGKFCNETCPQDRWGLDCKENCITKCKICDKTIGCVKCSGNWFGKNCSDELPVALRAPWLQAVTDNSITIKFDLEYGETQTKPDFYRVEYKENSGQYKAFNNYERYQTSPKTVTITEILPRKFSYKFRVVFKVQNHSFDEDVPEMTYLHHLKVNENDDYIEVQWDSNGMSHRVEYECFSPFCSRPFPFRIRTLRLNNSKIENLKFKNCSIKLSNFHLIDEIFQDFEKSKSLRDTDLPKSAALSENKIILNLNNCSKFSGALSYLLSFKCLSEWCKNELSNNYKIKVDSYKQVLEENIQALRPYSLYELNITAIRGSKTRTKLYSVSTPSGIPKPVQNLSVYQNNDETLWLKWKKPYPPTGKNEYHVFYNAGNEQKNFTMFEEGCEVWKDFICTNVTNLDHNVLTILVRDFNSGSWSDPVRLATNPLVEKKSHPPKDLRIKKVKSDRILLEWEHPSFVYGNVSTFFVEVNDKRIDNAIEKSLPKYSFELEIKNANYTVRVWVNNGDKAEIRMSVLQPIIELSPNLIVEWCSNKCYLSVPNLNTRIRLFILKKDQASEEEVRMKYKLVKDRSSLDGWIVESSSEEDNLINFEINSFNKKGVSMKSDSYDMYIAVEKKSLEFYLLQFETPPVAYILQGNLSYILVSSLIGLTLIFALGCFYFRYKYRSKTRNSESLHDMQLLQRDPIEEPSSIERHNFEKYVRDGIAQNELVKQFFALPNEKTKSCFVALDKKNLKKNKDINYITYDGTRVVLQDLSEIGRGDYINASYIDGYNKPKAYIACQGPKFYTVQDFWRMVWQEKVEMIVMATNFVEDEERMCAEYWTAKLNTILECGALAVKLVKEEIFEHYCRRVFELNYVRYRRTVVHIQLKWKSDSQHPLFSYNILPVVKLIREKSAKSAAPIVIHSGMGVNRCGILILCDLALQMMEAEEKINVYMLLKNLRKQRPHMINKKEYYIFIHLLILEYVLERRHLFKESVRENLDLNVIKEQIDFLTQMSSLDMLTPNFYPNLKTDYILADGYADRRFLITKLPTRSSVSKFWNKVVDCNVQQILFLNPTKQNVYPVEHYNALSTVKVKLLEEKDCEEGFRLTYLGLLSYVTKTKEVLMDKEVCLYQLKQWDFKQCSDNSIEPVLHIIRDIRQNCKGSEPILVASQTDASVLVAALFYLLEKYDNELEIDVSSVLRSVKRSSTDFVYKPHHFKFLYSSVLKYIESFDRYKCVQE